MPLKITPEVERVFLQLLWIEHRRARIVGSVGAHFGVQKITAILEKEKLLPAPLAGEPAFQDLLDDREPEDFVASLAREVDRHEAATITALRKHVSIYQKHVDEQVLFGSRTSGQEAGRSFLAKSRLAMRGRQKLSITEAVQAVFQLTFNGLPEEKNHFLTVRPFGGTTVHYTRSPHLISWNEAGADAKFLYGVKSEWIRGILDILCPDASFVTSRSIEKGHEYGLAHFYRKGLHAGL